jgi:hypothetical protein
MKRWSSGKRADSIECRYQSVEGRLRAEREMCRLREVHIYVQGVQGQRANASIVVIQHK